MIKLADLKIDTKKRWEQSYFLEHDKIPYSEESPFLKSLSELTPWVPYEKYMQAKLIAATTGQVGLLHVKFPPEFAEDNRLHTHVHSDRLITVLAGSGQFLVAPAGESIRSITVKTGDRVWMPRGIRHTWYSGSDGLTVESIHNPFFAFDDIDLLVYDDGLGYLEFNPDGSFVEINRIDQRTPFGAQVAAHEPTLQASNI